MKKTETLNIYRQTNAFAMQYGSILGAWLILNFLAFVNSPQYPSLGMLYMIMGLISFLPLPIILNKKFRKNISEVGKESLSFGRSFLHSLLMGFYATLWLALSAYIYFAYFDQGAFINGIDYQMHLPAAAPMLLELNSAIKDMGVENMKNFSDLLEVYRSITPSQYVGVIASFSLFYVPFISLFVALFTMKRSYLQKNSCIHN